MHHNLKKNNSAILNLGLKRGKIIRYNKQIEL